MFKWILLFLALCWSAPASAQNPTCPTRPVGDSTNACASTAFVHNTVNTGTSFVSAALNGVVCDGSTNDATALNTLITSMTNGGTLILGNASGTSTCKVNSSITLASNVTLQCTQGTTILTSVAPSYAAVFIPSGVADANVYDCTINGNSVTNGTRTADGIYYQAGSIRGKALRNNVFATADNGIESDGTYTELAFNYVHGCMTNGIYVIGGANAGLAAIGIDIHDNNVQNNSIGVANMWDGIDVDGNSQTVKIHHNYVVGNDIILFESGAVTSNSFGHQVTNNTISASTENGIDTGPANGAFTLSNLLVSGNTIINPIGGGIVIFRTVTNSIYSNNTIAGSTGGGITMQTASSAAPSDDLITGNYITNAGSVSNTHSGIELLNSGFNLTVSNNKISDNRGTPLMKYAIDAGSAAANRTVVLKDNTVGTNGVSGIINVLATQVANNNPGFNPTGAVSNPGIPSSTSPLTNPYPYTVSVYLNASVPGGSMTAVAINGTSTGVLSGDYILQAGDTITLTYTGTPSWVWFGR